MYVPTFMRPSNNPLKFRSPKSIACVKNLCGGLNECPHVFHSGQTGVVFLAEYLRSHGRVHSWPQLRGGGKPLQYDSMYIVRGRHSSPLGHAAEVRGVRQCPKFRGVARMASSTPHRATRFWQTVARAEPDTITVLYIGYIKNKKCVSIKYQKNTTNGAPKHLGSWSRDRSSTIPYPTYPIRYLT